MATPAGWYPDPSQAGRYRWWDGASWTDYTQSASGAPLAPPTGGSVASQPPPPPPPPPASSASGGGTFPPPPPAFGTPTAYANAGQGHPSTSLYQKASYGKRFAAVMLDSIYCVWPMLIAMVLMIVAAANSNQSSSNEDLSLSGGWAAVFALAIIFGALATLIVGIWNSVVRQGRTGQSFGKKKMGLALVNASTGTTVGGWRVLGRYLVASMLGNLTAGIFGLIDYLWPLWDDRGQRLVDKMLGTVVIPCTDASQIPQRQK